MRVNDVDEQRSSSFIIIIGSNGGKTRNRPITDQRQWKLCVNHAMTKNTEPK